MNNLRIEKRNNGVYLTCDRGMVAQMLAGYSQTQEEDVRILAAAPDLLAALKWIAEHGDTGAGGRPAYHDMRDHARKAIAKAEGRP